MVGIRWSEPALDDLDEIERYIASDFPHQAKIFLSGIFEMVEHLSSFPRIGKKMLDSKDPNLRVIIYRNYQMIYQIFENYLEIVRVLHGSRIFQ